MSSHSVKMPASCLRLFWVMSLLLLSAVNASANVERHALIIGNSGYVDRPLINPINDATDMAQQLTTLGYKVYRGAPALDLDRIDIERTVRAFARQLPENAHALFYFAGHGMAHEQDNYLIPVRHSLEFAEQLPDRAVSLRSVVNLLKNANPEGINVVLLDACSDNPLTTKFRSLRQGLDRLYDIPRGVFVGYAADVGQVADDGMDRNGTYTSELLSVMRESPNLIIELAHKEVAERVLEKTGGKQFPVSENKVYGNWCFGECAKSISTTTAIAQQDGVAAVDDPETPTSNRKWWVIGGVVLTAIIAGIVDDPSDPPPLDDQPPGPVTVTTPLP